MMELSIAMAVRCRTVCQSTGQREMVMNFSDFSEDLGPQVRLLNAASRPNMDLLNDTLPGREGSQARTAMDQRSARHQTLFVYAVDRSVQ